MRRGACRTAWSTAEWSADGETWTRFGPTRSIEGVELPATTGPELTVTGVEADATFGVGAGIPMALKQRRDQAEPVAVPVVNDAHRTLSARNMIAN